MVTHAKPDAERQSHYLRPVLIVLSFLLPMVILTVYFSDQTQPTPFVPSNILVLALLNVDIILLVVLLLKPEGLFGLHMRKKV